MKQSDYSGNPLRGHASSSNRKMNPFKMRMKLVLGPGLSNESHRILKPGGRKEDDVRCSRFYRNEKKNIFNRLKSIFKFVSLKYEHYLELPKYDSSTTAMYHS
ncbi:hypothetical protein CDAR_283831 [Caerostris darwini]|uniref:Ycf1 n=1 Tax=Caerostris darwini TaxID=1538125 RepID=A0AAV4ND10_9ARAC|nr:hypothetical protein CDAR_283831 [Caerostris darwini]